MNSGLEHQPKLKPAPEAFKNQDLPKEIKLDNVMLRKEIINEQLRRKELYEQEKTNHQAEIARLRKELGADTIKEEPESDQEWEEKERIESIVNQHLETAVYEKINDAPLLSPRQEIVPPFKNFTENSKEAWQYVPPQEVEKFLKERFFLNTDIIDYEDMTGLFTVRKRENEDSIKIPLDLVVAAAGFEDWRGRGEDIGKTWQSEYGYGETNSLEVIKHYAGLPSEPPPVSRMRMFIQPNGKIFFDNGSGDSHRIAVAMLRGKEFIETKKVNVYRLSKNYIK